jgi:hypothetical protein
MDGDMANDASTLLEAVIRPGDRVCLEGDNQKQADLLAAALVAPATGTRLLSGIDGSAVFDVLPRAGTWPGAGREGGGH